MANPSYLGFSDSRDNTQFVKSGGAATSTTDLRFAAGINAGETFEQGTALSLNANLLLEVGLVQPTSMPLFAVNGSHDPDAGQFPGELMKDVEGAETGYGGQGVANTLPASGGYELSTTAWDDTNYVAADYHPGYQLLTINADGEVYPAPADYSNYLICGCVSTGVVTARVGVNRSRIRLGQKNMLSFWTLYVPPVVTTEGSGS